MKRILTFLTLLTLTATAAQADPGPRTLADMIAAGHYDDAAPAIDSKHFPVRPDRFTASHLVRIGFTGKVKTNEALKQLDAWGLRPATIEELLAYGAEYPEFQRHYALVALGSGWRYHDGTLLAAPFLGNFDGKRMLDVEGAAPNNEWDESWFFLAAPK